MRILTSAEVSPTFKVTRRLTSVQCDQCGETMQAIDDYGVDRRYYEVTTGHGDWGSESIESFKSKDICRKCLPEYLAEWMKTESSTAEFSIITKTCCPKFYEKYLDTEPEEGMIYEEDHDFW